jgi:MFS transporter, DHA1 family, multidrug resistance protein
MQRFLTPFIMLCLVGFSARLGYQMARPPVLPRFAAELGAEAWLIGLIVGASTMTGVFIKFPAGALSDILGRRRMLLLGAAFFALRDLHPPRRQRGRKSGAGSSSCRACGR